ncbi:MAG: hypothetical protein GNW80_03985 [Asgard group archaeon]|nr:hypothetical protein [Asgard group archaeon]
MTKKESNIESVKEEKKAKFSGKTFWTWFKLLAMKWRFRLDQSRAIFGLLTFAALLAVSYVSKIPWFRDQGFWRGEFFLTILILIVFMMGGYLYDKFLRLWAQTGTVTVSRNPYTYVPSPKEFNSTISWFTYIFTALNQIAKKLDIEIEGEELIKQQLTHYVSLSVEDSDFQEQAKKLKKLSHLILESYIDSEEIVDIDEFLADFEKYLKNVKKKN